MNQRTSERIKETHIHALKSTSYTCTHSANTLKWNTEFLFRNVEEKSKKIKVDSPLIRIKGMHWFAKSNGSTVVVVAIVVFNENLTSKSNEVHTQAIL